MESAVGRDILRAKNYGKWKYGWEPADIALIIILFAAIYVVAIWSGIIERKDNAGKRHKKSGIDFFLGGRHMGWIIIGVSIAASNIGI